MSHRLPSPGSDAGNWGSILNDFLDQSHNSDGTLIPSSVAAAGAQMTSASGQANGYPSLDGSSKINISNLPTGTSSATVALGSDSRFQAASTAVQSVNAKTGTSVTLTASDLTAADAPKIGQNNLTGMWHVDGYGTVGDGVTPDSSAFQAAINAAATHGGGTVYCAAKTYLISGVYLASNVTLAGAGKAATILLQDPAGTNGQWVIRAANGSTTAAATVTVRDLTIDGNKSTIGNAQTTKWYGYYLGTNTVGLVTDYSVERVEFRNCISYALDIVNAKRVTVVDCDSHDNGFTSGTGTFNGCSGIEVLADDVTIIGCRAWNNASKGFISGEGGVTHYRTKFVGCTAEANTSDGFYFHDGLTDSSIQGGVSRDNGASGISLSSSTMHSAVVGIVITGNGGNGIRFDNANFNTISSCILDGNTPGSIGNPELYFVNNSSHNTVVGLVINATKATNAIQETAGADYQTLRANTIQAGAVVIVGTHSTTSDASSASISTALPQADGAPLAGSTGQISDAGHTHLKQVVWAATDSSFIAASDDPAHIASSVLVNGGILFLIKLPILQNVTVSNVILQVATGGSGLTTGQNFVGLYSQSGALIGSSADQTTPFASSGSKIIALTAQSAGSLTLTGSASTFVWAAILANGTTAPLIGRVGTQNTMANIGFSAANYRFAQNTSTGLTALPLSFTPATSLATTSALWAAIS